MKTQTNLLEVNMGVMIFARTSDRDLNLAFYEFNQLRSDVMCFIGPEFAERYNKILTDQLVTSLMNGQYTLRETIPKTHDGNICREIIGFISETDGKLSAHTCEIICELLLRGQWIEHGKFNTKDDRNEFIQLLKDCVENHEHMLWC